MELLYIWIEEYKNIKKQGFNFSSEFIFNYNSENKELLIDKNPNYIPNFFPEEFSNVTAIIGENGSGKSSVLELLLSKGPYQGIFFLVKPYQENKIIMQYYEMYFQDIKLNNKLKYKHTIEKRGDFDLPNLGTPLISFVSPMRLSGYRPTILYYSPLINTFNLRQNTTSEVFDYSLLTFLDEGLKEYEYNITLLQFNFLKEDNAEYLRSFSHFPNFLIIKNSSIEDLVKGIDIQYIPDLHALQEVMQGEIQLNINELSLIWIQVLWHSIFTILKQITNHDKYTITFPEQITNAQELRKLLINKITDEDDFNYKMQYLDYLNKVDVFINSIQNLISDSNYRPKKIYHDFLKRDKLEGMLIDLSGKHDKFFNDFFIPYIQTKLEYDGHDNFLKFEWKGLSSGEINRLNLYSIFYKMYQEVTYTSPYLLILIDEGETGFHPQWQKQYLNMLLSFLPKILRDSEIQLILTSHSPFIASDLPNSNIIFLEKGEDGNCIVKDSLNEMKETFGANIHTLFTDSFFTRGGLIGDFAKGKINEIIKYLNNETSEIQDIEIAQKYIDLIGEPIIRNQLQKRLDSRRLTKVDEIDNIKSQIEDLQTRLRNLEDDKDSE